MDTKEKIRWCIDRHYEVNQKYDNYLPYEFHLHQVANVGREFIAIIENNWTDIIIACYAHDLIEDARITYNDCKNALGEYVAEIAYAVTNEKGKNRSERASDKYYEGIRNTPGAVFVKLCDRIANVKYSKETKSSMLSVYRKENESFLKRLDVSSIDRFAPMAKKILEYL